MNRKLRMTVRVRTFRRKACRFMRRYSLKCSAQKSGRSVPDRTGIEDSVRPPGVSIGDADHQLQESQKSCRPTAPREYPANPYSMTDEGGFCGNNGYMKPKHGAVLLRPR
jgi:hypothetical protein